VPRERNNRLPLERIPEGERELAVAHHRVLTDPDSHAAVAGLPLETITRAGEVVDLATHIAHRALDADIDILRIVPISVAEFQFRHRGHRKIATRRGWTAECEQGW
jgi:hypothetical protein